MRQFFTLALLLSLVPGLWFANSLAQESAPEAAEREADKESKMAIVPLVTVSPGETKELILSTWCTVGVTRGGGFGLSEMRDGKPVGGGYGEKEYRQRGVTISVPSFKEGTAFANAPEYSRLKRHDLQAFQVTISASADAEPGLLGMHLVDSTCAGQCKTDFRVLVVER